MDTRVPMVASGSLGIRLLELVYIFVATLAIQSVPTELGDLASEMTPPARAL